VELVSGSLIFATKASLACHISQEPPPKGRLQAHSASGSWFEEVLPVT